MVVGNMLADQSTLIYNFLHGFTDPSGLKIGNIMWSHIDATKLLIVSDLTTTDAVCDTWSI